MSLSKGSDIPFTVDQLLQFTRFIFHSCFCPGSLNKILLKFWDLIYFFKKGKNIYYAKKIKID